LAQSKYAEQINELTLQSRKSAEVQARAEAQRESISKRLEKLEDIPVALATLTETVSKLHDTCPHIVKIAKAANNINRVDNIEKEVNALKERQHEDRLEVVKGWAKVALVAAIGGGTVKGAEALFSLFN